MFPLRDSTHLNYLSQNVTFSHLLFGRVSLGRKTISSIRSTHYSSLTIHLFIAIRSFHVSLLTFHLKQLVLIQTLHLVIYPTNNFKSAEPKRITPTTIATTEANITAPAEISLAIPTNLEYRL